MAGGRAVPLKDGWARGVSGRAIEFCHAPFVAGRFTRGRGTSGIGAGFGRAEFETALFPRGWRASPAGRVFAGFSC